MANPRIARVRLTVPATSGAVVELPLPHLEGVEILPRRLIAGVDVLALGAGAFIGISHYLDLPAPTGLNDHFDDPTYWWWTTLDGSNARHSNLVGEGIELAGPQTFSVFNNSAGQRTFGLMLWYTTRTVDLTHWANLVRSTSFEDL